MFEKEADFAETKMLINCNGDYSKKQDYKKGWQDGAEFGYNKANEWHYVKDGDLPKDMENVLINAFDYGINTCYVAHRLNGKWKSNCSSEIFVHVIAWKEIIPPKEIKEND